MDGRNDPGVGGPSILIVDDHAGFRGMARDLLSGRGFDVVGEAAGGWEALAEATRLAPRVVLLDVQLPDLDGFEVARRLSSLTDPPVVVFVSTREAADYGARLQVAGAVGFITKSRLAGDTLRAVLRGTVEEFE